MQAHAVLCKMDGEVWIKCSDCPGASLSSTCREVFWSCVPFFIALSISQKQMGTAFKIEMKKNTKATMYCHCSIGTKICDMGHLFWVSIFMSIIGQ